ncbi:hypothetical protein [Ferruginibacter sp.]
MGKIVAALILLCGFFACKQASKKTVADTPIAKNDTFDFFYDEYNIPIVAGFAVDSLKKYDKATDYTERLIYPYLTEKAYKKVNGILKNEIERKAALCYVDSTDTQPVDTSEEVLGVEIDNILLQMYAKGKLVSYGFLSESSEPHQMRPFRKYFSVNYDTAKKKFILFDDYFKISGHDDSALVRSIIYSEVGNPDFNFISLGNEINFSFDKDHIYFYFDMFGDLGNPIGEVKRVKRKYLDNFINNDYK